MYYMWYLVVQQMNDYLKWTAPLSGLKTLAFHRGGGGKEKIFRPISIKIPNLELIVTSLLQTSKWKTSLWLKKKISNLPLLTPPPLLARRRLSLLPPLCRLVFISGIPVGLSYILFRPNPQSRRSHGALVPLFIHSSGLFEIYIEIYWKRGGGGCRMGRTIYNWVRSIIGGGAARTS